MSLASGEALPANSLVIRKQRADGRCGGWGRAGKACKRRQSRGRCFSRYLLCCGLKLGDGRRAGNCGCDVGGPVEADDGGGTGALPQGCRRDSRHAAYSRRTRPAPKLHKSGPSLAQNMPQVVPEAERFVPDSISGRGQPLFGKAQPNLDRIRETSTKVDRCCGCWLATVGHKRPMWAQFDHHAADINQFRATCEPSSAHERPTIPCQKTRSIQEEPSLTRTDASCIARRHVAES